jgi:hypothetical protein
MLSQPIELAITSVGAGILTDVFIAVLVVVFAAGVHFKRGNHHHAFTQYIPTLLTTLGILGTFFGIVAGLLGFDVTDIDSSISALLAGMKTAFTTSLVGMLLAVVYKVAASVGWLAPRELDAIDEDQIGVAELYQVMVEQRDGVVALQKSIGSGDESSLTGQMKLLRSDVNDNHKVSQKDFETFQDRLWIKLQDFADMMSKSATEQVIEALKQVITDFNNNLTEQFGDNFKQLNEAVLRLVEWQENYRVQLEDMIQQYTHGVQAITQTEASVASINEKAGEIPQSMERLGQVMTVNQHQIDELGRHLDAFKDIRDKAVEAVPQIHAQIDSTLKGVEEASQKLATGMQLAGEQLQTAIVQGAQEFVDSSQRVNASMQTSSDVISKNSEEVKTQFSDLVTELNTSFRGLFAEIDGQNTSMATQYKKATDTLVAQIDRTRAGFEDGLRIMQERFLESLTGMTEEQTRETQRLMNGLRSGVETALADTGEAVKKQVNMLDQAREREMNAIAKEMGSALASISGQFTNDYERLVQAMKKITGA